MHVWGDKLHRVKLLSEYALLQSSRVITTIFTRSEQAICMCYVSGVAISCQSLLVMCEVHWCPSLKTALFFAFVTMSCYDLLR